MMTIPDETSAELQEALALFLRDTAQGDSTTAAARDALVQFVSHHLLTAEGAVILGALRATGRLGASALAWFEENAGDPLADQRKDGSFG
jgi:hypothetical protein